MYERELNNRGNNDAVVEIPLHVKDQEVRPNGYRSRVTRDGTVSLEIEIPRHGGTCCCRCFFLLFLTVPFVFFFGGIVFSVFGVMNNGASGLFPLIGTAFAIVFISFTLLGVKSSAFTQTNLKITTNNYCLVRTGITWRSFFRIMFLPTHFNDLETGQFDETNPVETQHVRQASLQAEIVTHHDNDNNSVTKDIKLGSISFARGLIDEELEWLMEEINSFLRETRS